MLNGSHMHTSCMSSGKFIKTKFSGVYYRELKKIDPRTGKPDRSYYYWQPADGKGKFVQVGLHSQGVRPQTVMQERATFVSTSAVNPSHASHDTFSVGEAVELYAAWGKAEGKHIDKPMQQYNKHLRASLHAVPIVAVTSGLLTRIKNHMLETLSPQSVKLAFTFVRSAVNRSIAIGRWVGVNPFSSRPGAWQMPKVDNTRIRYFTPHEAAALLEELGHRSLQLRDMTMLSLRTGMRATEIFKLRGQDVAPAAGIIYCIAKGGQREVVHAPADVITLLQSYHRSPEEFIFQERNTGKALQRISDTFERAVKAIGIANDDRHSPYHITFHTCRHTFASWLAQSGKVTLLELKALMRHSSLTMTQRYAHLIPGQEATKLHIIADALFHS